ncbi:7251_t:CDS:2, partial [Dentiscutata heterogama]
SQKTWGKLSKKDLENVLNLYKTVHTKGYYPILDFWTGVAEIHYNGPKNNDQSLIKNVQVLINSCEDLNNLKSVVKYVSNLSEQQIKKIILKNEISRKFNIINNYSKIKSQSGLPLWFSKGLEKLKDYEDELINVSIMNPIFCNIIDIKYDNIYLGVTNALSKFKMNSKSIPLIEINKFQEKECRLYCDILKLWFREWVNPTPVMSESYYVGIYIYQPLQIILHDLLYSRFHLFGPEHETKCSFERRSWHHYWPAWAYLQLEKFRNFQNTQRLIRQSAADETHRPPIAIEIIERSTYTDGWRYNETKTSPIPCSFVQAM